MSQALIKPITNRHGLFYRTQLPYSVNDGTIELWRRGHIGPRYGAMRGLTPQARVIWLIIVLAGTSTAAVSAWESATLLLKGPVELLGPCAFVFVFGALAQTCRVRLPNPGRSLGSYIRKAAGGYGQGRFELSSGVLEREGLSLAGAVLVFGLLALPAELAVALAFTSALIGGLFVSSRSYQRIFNASQYALAVWAAASLWQLSQVGSPAPEATVMWLAATLLLYGLINSGSVAASLVLFENLPLQLVWGRGRRFLLLSYVLVLIAGSFFWYLWRTDSLIPSGPAILLAAMAIYRSLNHTVLLHQQTADTLSELADLVDQRDYYTHEHSLRVGGYAERLAAHLRLSYQETQLIFLAGRLHDIGKCAVSNDVLLKPGPLGPLERDEMIRHASIGAAMLEHFTQFKAGATYVRYHHEAYNGSGYPEGLSRSKIPLGARIIAVADAYDAMTSDRPYRRALPQPEVIRRLMAGSGSQWDPRVVLAFLELLGYAPPSAPGVISRLAGGARGTARAASA